jgi:hypothetical protein
LAGAASNPAFPGSRGRAGLLFNLLHDLNELSVGFVSLRDDWYNTTTSTGRLVRTIMAGIAEFEPAASVTAPDPRIVSANLSRLARSET